MYLTVSRKVASRKDYSKEGTKCKLFCMCNSKVFKNILLIVPAIHEQSLLHTQQVAIVNMKTAWYIGPSENIIGKASDIQ